jgi:leader peptidase (prepilin peptidase)/N-methyltransferase
MEIIMVIYVALVGMVIGSFLNVCIYRIPKGESIVYPPSHCGSCGRRLKALDLVPVFSWLFLKGKCRSCGSKISPRYAVVESLTGLVFVLLYKTFGISVDFLTSAFIMSILVAVFFIDIDHRIIPDELVLTGLIAGGLVTIYNAFFPMKIYGEGAKWWDPIIGMFAGSLTLLIVGIIGMMIYKTDDALGGGDIKIFAPIGIFLGWKMTFVALLLSIFLGGIISLILIIIRVKGRKSTIPFGPFIVMGTLITYIYGWDILRWYINSLIF